MELYVIDFRAAHVKARFPALLKTLSEEAQDKVLRMKNEDDRCRVLTGLYLRKHVLDTRFGAGQYRLTENEYGKPLLSSPDVPFYFNTSHSGHYVLFGFGETPLGVDVEKPRTGISVERLLRFYSDEEAARVRFSADPAAAFYEIWTMREAFSKLVGVGLTLFSREEIRIDHDKKNVRYHDKIYTFYTDIRDGHRIAVCAEGRELPPRILTELS